MSELPVLRTAAWNGATAVVHGFLGRDGGVSRGAFASLNLSTRVGDDEAAVAANRRRVLASLPAGSQLVGMQQVHGSRVATVVSGDEPVGEADAMVTATRGLLLTVLTADCVPVLIAARRAAVVAAVHAGWRGTVAGIAAHTVRALQQLGVAPDELEVALGPAIGGCCYEVDREIGAQFVERWSDAPPSSWRQHGAKGRLDLRQANAHILRCVGVAGDRIHLVGPCTQCTADRYFSHRAARGPTGRQIAFIGLAP
jgi:hypothetical protein